MKNPHAVALAKLSKGVKKRISESDRLRRKQWAKGLAKRKTAVR